MFVKRPGFVVVGVNCERANADNVRGLQRALHCVLEQPGTEVFAMPGCRDGETGEKQDGNRMAGETLDQPLWRHGIFDLAYDKRVVAHDDVLRKGYMGLRSAGLLVLERITRQKPVESFPTAIKFIDVVAALEFLNPERSH
jgi:hypothetical protein